MTTIQQLEENLKKMWPPLIAREKIAEYTGGLYTAGTMATYDAKGVGVPNPVRIDGRKVAYVKEELINWIIKKMETTNANAR